MSRPRARKQVKAKVQATNDADYKNQVKTATNFESTFTDF